MLISKMGCAKNQSENYVYQTWSQFSNAITNKICQNHATLENLKKTTEIQSQTMVIQLISMLLNSGSGHSKPMAHRQILLLRQKKFNVIYCRSSYCLGSNKCYEHVLAILISGIIQKIFFSKIHLQFTIMTKIALFSNIEISCITIV